MTTENGLPLPGQTIFPEWKGTGEYKLPSSDDFNDPPLGEMLHWHLQRCSRCDPDRKVFKFGQRSEAFCDEYWGIIAEYAEYEGHYAMRGNP